MPDVFELTMAPGRRTASTRASSSRLASSCSTMASITQSASAIRPRSLSKPPTVTSAARSGAKNGSGRSLRARSRPARAVASSRSSSKAGTPAFAKCAAIWAPIVPAPSTATDPTKSGRGLRATSIASGLLRVETASRQEAGAAPTRQRGPRTRAARCPTVRTNTPDICAMKSAVNGRMNSAPNCWAVRGSLTRAETRTPT